MSSVNTQLAHAFKSACLAELEALKPGNVHIFSDGHGMTVQDFIRSAEAASAVIAKPDITVGERILNAVTATSDVVKYNTNLGVILLCAPIIHAAISRPEPDLKKSLQTTLQNLNVEDAKLAFEAILKAAPAGLGEVSQHDVHRTPTVTLLEVMRVAQERDLIARQYANGFADAFDGATHYQNLLQRWQRPAWAATAVYLGFLANFADSHIARKYGIAVAQTVQQEASAHQQALLAQENPKMHQPNLLKFDADLKMRGINPGASADLTVASLLMAFLEKAMRS